MNGLSQGLPTSVESKRVCVSLAARSYGEPRRQQHAEKSGSYAKREELTPLSQSRSYADHDATHLKIRTLSTTDTLTVRMTLDDQPNAFVWVNLNMQRHPQEYHGRQQSPSSQQPFDVRIVLQANVHAHAHLILVHLPAHLLRRHPQLQWLCRSHLSLHLRFKTVEPPIDP
jgi:hypothetical protein